MTESWAKRCVLLMEVFGGVLSVCSFVCCVFFFKSTDTGAGSWACKRQTDGEAEFGEED